MGSVWALIRRGRNGTYHRIEDRHPHRYINGFAGRLNMRAFSTVGKMRKMVRGRVGKRLTYKQLVAGSALCGQPWWGIRPASPVTSGMVAAINQAVSHATGNKRSYRQGCSRDGICRTPNLGVVAAKRSI